MPFGHPVESCAFDENGCAELYDYRARRYDPVLKWFISEDRIMVLAAVYCDGYVEGNPLLFIDLL